MKLIGQLWYILSHRERIEGSILLCGMALAALFEAVSIGLVVPFIAVLNDPQLVLEAPLARPFLAAFNIHDTRILLITLGLGLIAAFVVKSSYLILLYAWLYRYIFQLQVNVTRNLLTAYLRAPYTFHQQRNSAELIKTTTQTAHRFASGFLVSLLTVLGESLVVAALIALLLLVSPVATIGAVLALGVPVALIYWLLRRRLAESGAMLERSMSSMVQWSEQALSGIKETLVTERAGFFIDRHAYHAQRFANAMRGMMIQSNLPRLLTDTFAVATMITIALVILIRNGDISSLLPVLSLFAVAAIRLMPSTTRIAVATAQLRFHYAAAETLYNELREHEAESRQHRPMPATSAAADSGTLPFERSLVLDHLTYLYPSMPEPAIDDLSFEIRKGEWIGIIGPTGAGKTTLVDLMLGLYVPSSGQILVDGRDLRDNVAGWQRNIGYVPQDIYLLDDSIRRNVAFGLPDEEIDDARVWQALAAAQIADLVRSLPGGLDAVTGERGERLSGGERQRIGMARALYRDPQVLVVDEGTANLDNETEAAIVDTLDRLRHGKTIIVIAHRLGVVKKCDRVYLLRGGRLQKSGTFSQLFLTDGTFREFVGAASGP